MIERKRYKPDPRKLFERRIHHQFGLSHAVLRALSELNYLGRD